MTKVLIVDDHDLVRLALRNLLEAEGGMEVVGEVATGEEALEFLASDPADLVMLDLHMPGRGGVETCREVCERHPLTRVLILTSYDDEDEVLGALSAGASGYLMKDSTSDVVMQAVRSVLDGVTVLDDSVARQVIDGRSPTPVDDAGLSNREMDVLALMARGCTNRQIAQSLWISEPTVKTHVSRVLRKLGQSDRTQAVIDAIKRGIVKVSPDRESGPGTSPRG